MINILKAELFKLKKSKSAWICMAILFGYILLVIAMMLGIRNAVGGIGGMGGLIGGLIPEYSASSALQFFASDFQIILILVCVVICGFYAGEYKNGLIRNALTAGVSRTKVFFAKFIMAMSVSAAVYLVVSAIYITVYGIAGGWGDLNGGVFIGFWLLVFLQFLATAALVFMFSILTKSTGATIGITIGLTFFFSILASLGMLGEFFPDSAFVKFLSEFSMLFSGAQITKAAEMAAAETLNVWRVVESVLVGAVTLGACAFGGWAMFRNQDQK